MSKSAAPQVPWNGHRAFLSLHPWVGSAIRGAIVRAAQGITHRDKLNDLGSRLKLHQHALGAPAPPGHFPVVIAERLPTHTVDGKQLWIYTMMDGSVQISGTPLTEDGFLPTDALN